jgi:hypothetical protein
MLKKIEIVFCFFFLFFVKTVDGQTSHIITPDKLYLNGLDAAYQDVKPGDTLIFAAGAKNYLLIKNFHGAPGKPLVMINSGGPIIIDTDHYYGISIANCQYIKLTGTGDPSQNYGFQVKRVANGSGVGIGDLSSDFEIDHVSIENCKIGGLYAKTDPDCSLTSVRGNFTQYNTIIHDNYIANVADEGMYIGSTKYDGQTVFCNGKDTVLMPSLLDGVRVYNNIVKYSGWDGIQVSSAYKDCQIYNNTILFDSQAESNAQMSGIMIGGGTKCDCFNNFISQGKGDGIESHGLGGTRIFNNIILDAGRSFWPADLTQMKYGIYISDNDASVYIVNNNIINPKSDGIRFASVTGNVNVIASNVIINPGNFDLYQNGNTWAKGVDSYVMRPDPGFILTLQNNYFARNADSVKFASTLFQSPFDFKLLAGSPLIDRAEIDNNINFDFAGSPRPYGIKSDIGAFEFRSDTVSNPKPTSYGVTGGGSYCAGGTGLEIGLNGSQNGVSYELVLNGTKSGKLVNGTGTAISFGLQTVAGTYTVIGTDATTLVPNTMTGSGSILVNPAPNVPDPISGNKSVCVGSTTTLTDAVVGGVWSSSSPTIASVSTTGVVKGITAGTATIQYTITNESGCKTSTSTNIIIDKAVSQPGKFTKYSSRVTQGQLNVTYTVPLVSGVTYNWRYSGLGATITGTGNSILLSFSKSATSGNLNVTASNGCGTSRPRSIAISVSRLKDANLLLDSTAFSATGAFESLIEVAPVKNSLSVYPNPSLGETTFNMQIDKNSHVTLEIFTLSGKLAARVCDADLDAGVPYKVFFQQPLASGIYTCVMRWADNRIITKLLVKK